MLLQQCLPGADSRVARRVFLLRALALILLELLLMLPLQGGDLVLMRPLRVVAPLLRVSRLLLALGLLRRLLHVLALERVNLLLMLLLDCA